MTPQSSAPPHPFRTAPWYDPELVDRPAAVPLKSSVGRIALVWLGGILLPIVSVLVNSELHVVDLGAGGIALCALSVLAVLLNLHWVRRKTRKQPAEVAVEAPRSWVAFLLLGLSLSSLLWWAYLSVLFFPLFPLSVIAIIFVGIGFCGLCPFFVTAISGVQTVRLVRLLKDRGLGRWALALVVFIPLATVAAITASTVLANHERRLVDQQVRVLAAYPAYSSKRMKAIAALKGREELLAQAALREHDDTRRRALAEAYQRLTDEPIRGAMERLRPQGRRHHYAIRPFFFWHGEEPLGFLLADPFNRLFRL